MLLRQASLDALNNKLGDARIKLLEKAMKVYDALKKLHASAERLHEMKEIDEYNSSLSSEYILALKNDPAIGRVDARIREISGMIDQSDLIKLLEKTERLITALSDEELIANARFLDALRNPVILQIKNSLDANETKQFNAGKIKVSSQANGNHLYFPGMFAAMPLPLLLQYANEVMWDAKNHKTWKVFLQATELGENTMYDYIRCGYWYISKKGYYLTIAPDKATFIHEKLIPAEQKEFAVHVNAVNDLMTAVGIQDEPLELDDQPDIGDARLLEDIKSCERGVEFLHRRFLEFARENAGNNTYLLNRFDDDLTAANKKIQFLADETETLRQLLLEQDALLVDAAKVRLGDIRNYEENAQIIHEKNVLIQARREAVENATRAVNESVRFAIVFDEEKQEGTHRGTRYVSMKRRYFSDIDPARQEALHNADSFLLQADNKKNEKFIAFAQHLKKSRQQALERQQELEKSPEFGLVFVPLASQCKELETACDSHAKLQGLLTQKGKEVYAILNTLEQKEVSLGELTKYEPYIQTHAAQGAELKKKLDEIRVTTAKRFAAITEQQKQLSELVRESKSYKELETGLASSRESFLANAVIQDMEVQSLKNAPTLLRNKIESTKSQLLKQLLERFNILFDSRHMETLWQIPKGFVLFGHSVKINVGTQRAPRMISVPVEIHDALDQIRMRTTEADQARVARDVCLKIKVRMGKDGKEKKLLAPVYSALCDFLSGDNNDLVITEEKLARLAKIMDTTTPSLHASASLSVRFN